MDKQSSVVAGWVLAAVAAAGAFLFSDGCRRDPKPVDPPVVAGPWIVLRDGKVADLPYLAEAAATTPPGSYSVVKFPLAGEPVYLSVVISAGQMPSPAPIPPTPPTPPAPPGPDGALSPSGRAARQAMLDYAADVAAYHEGLANGSFATVSDYFEATVASDKLAREKYGAKLKAIYKPVLGAGDYPAAGAKLNRDMAAGFKEASK